MGIADHAEVHAAVVAEGTAVKATVREREPRATSVSTEMASPEMASPEMPSAEMAANVTAAMTPTTMASAAASAERYARDQRGKNNDDNSNA